MPTNPTSDRQAVVIYNPTKVNEIEFRQLASEKAIVNRWQLTFLATTPHDPGHGAARRALELGADLVLAAGGDGTVRAVTGELRHRAPSCAIIPVGTANLLARNLGIPLDTAQALELAFTGVPRDIDLGKLIVDHDEDNAVYFTGMAGIGFDAALMRDTSQRLKKAVGAGAYLVAFAQQLGAQPRKVRYQIDNGHHGRRKAVLILIGNTSSLQGGIKLFPDAAPDDGRLDLLLASPRTLAGWARLLNVVLYKIRRSQAVEYHSGTRIVIDLDAAAPWEIDGDTEGTGRHFEFRIVPRALRVISSTGR